MDYLKDYNEMISMCGLNDHTMKSYQTYILNPFKALVFGDAHE